MIIKFLDRDNLNTCELKKHIVTDPELIENRCDLCVISTSNCSNIKCFDKATKEYSYFTLHKKHEISEVKRILTPHPRTCEDYEEDIKTLSEYLKWS